MPKEIKWAHTHPAHVVQMLVTDKNNQFLLMHRSNNVRSARNVWSIPTGSHELGETAFACIRRELAEEYGLVAKAIKHILTYENIAGDSESVEQYHWIMSLYQVRVDDVTKAINQEPDKHDRMEFRHLDSLCDPAFLSNHPFHPSLHTVLLYRAGDIMEALHRPFSYPNK